MNNVLAVKHAIKPLNGYMDVNRSDLYTFIRHTRKLQYVLRWSYVFKNQRVIDLGAGLGGCYLPLRFCQPAELIAVEPNFDNLKFLESNCAYDQIVNARWQDYTFNQGDCVFMKDPWISDWKHLINRCNDYGVTNIIIMLDFLDEENPRLFYSNEWSNDLITPHRLTCDEHLEHFWTPSLGFIRKLAESNGYTIRRALYENPLRDKDALMKRFNLHIQKKV